MATSVRLIRQHVWPGETIRRAGHITLEDINGIIKRYHPEVELSSVESSTPVPTVNTKDTSAATDKPYILFLDFDGVLNNGVYYRELQESGVETRDEYGPLFDPNAIAALGQIVNLLHSPQIVITSSWRYHMSLTDLKEMWCKRNMPGKIYGVLPRDSFCETRGEEISEYLSERGKDISYLIIDDEDSYSKAQKPHCLIVNPQTGLTEDSVKQVLRKL